MRNDIRQASRLARAAGWATVALGMSLAALTVSTASAETLRFKADMTGRGEAPPNNDVKATGHVDATFDTATNTLTWTCVFNGLTGPAIGAHFHGPVSYSGATSEENAPIQVGTPGSLTSPFKGSTTIDATQANDLKKGRWYFNLHSTKFPAGEIRGPVVRQ